MIKSRVTVTLIVLGIVAAAAWSAAIGTSASPDMSEQLQAPTAQAASTGPSIPQHTVAQQLPKAIIEVRGFDFGDIVPYRTYEHKFKIRNGGSAPLQLDSMGTTSDIMQVDLDAASIQPGEERIIVATWDAQPSDREFLEHAIIATNDPANPVIKLELLGRTRLLVAADPPSLTASRILPHESCLMETKIVSEHWDSFTIDEVRPSLAGVTWQLTPIAPADLDVPTAKSGWRLTVTLPAGLPEGPLSGHVAIVARPTLQQSSSAAGAAQTAVSTPVEREIPFDGKVVRRLSVFGKDINVAGTIEAGTIDSSRGYEATFTVRVNDTDPQLNVVDTTIYPKFVDVQLEPFSGAETTGLYRLSVRIPPQDVPAAYIGKNRGKLMILFDHPRIAELNLELDFIVKKSVTTKTERRVVTATKP
jgi:hypothetical protein